MMPKQESRLQKKRDSKKDNKMTASTLEPTWPDTTPGATQLGQLSARDAALLQLAPGVVSLFVFGIVAWMYGGWGLPSIMALGTSILIADVPVSWWIMVRLVRRETGGRFSLKDAFPWRKSIPWWQYLVIGVPVVLLSIAIIFAGVGVGEEIREALFGWVPDWFVIGVDPEMFAGMSRGALIAMLFLSIFAMTGLGGVTQELYSRGFLLPRTAHLGSKAPALNALWFALVHTASPWGWPGFFLLALPWAYLVWWKRSIKIGLFAHIGMLALQSTMLTLIVLGVVTIPAAGN